MCYVGIVRYRYNYMFCRYSVMCRTCNTSPSMSWFYNFYSNFSPNGGLCQGLPGRLDSYVTTVKKKEGKKKRGHSHKQSEGTVM